MIKILLAENEKPVADLIAVNLRNAGYDCLAAQNGMRALSLVEKQTFDLSLIDIVLPDLSGYELLDYLRPLDIPVIFLTGKDDIEERVRGLRLGAEDYITRPFAVAELLARVDVVLRRYCKLDEHLVIGDVEIAMEARRVTRSGIPVDLTMKEYQLLLLFIRNRNIALFREVIFERIWESDYLGDSRTVDLHVQRLRKKLGWEEKIKSVYKVGYRLDLAPGEIRHM